MDAPPLSEEELNQVYNWVDEIPLSRPKKNIARDFSDGVLLAEIIHHYAPKIVEIHNYSAANSTTQKLYNWNTLNQRVLKKMGFQLSKNDIDHVINCVPDAIERVLKVCQVKIEKYLQKPREGSKEGSITKGNENEERNNKGGQQFGIANYIPKEADIQVLMEKDQTIQELRETIEILELKIKKLEQLVKLKDSKIQTLTSKLAQAGIN